MSSPFISVVMPVYNGEKYLCEAIDSILNQTFKDFEFIILNDGSTDKTEEIILSYEDPRIKYVKNEVNLQIVKTLNKGIALAKGKYIARMDADDISLPQRFEKQLHFMESNPDVGVCGTWLKTFGEIEETWHMPTKHDEILVTLLFESCIMHPTVFLRKSTLPQQYDIYDECFNTAEDYELWTRLILNTRIANVPEVLLKYRVLDKLNNRSEYKLKQKSLADKVKIKYWSSFYDGYNNEFFDIHNRMLKVNTKLSKGDLVIVREFFLRLSICLCVSQFVDNKILAEKTLVNKYYAICLEAQKKLPKYLVYREFLKLTGCRFFSIRCKMLVKMFLC